LRVEAVSLSPRHGFSKQPQSRIRLVEGLGVEGDAHFGALVQHVYNKRKNPSQPNLKQVHLLASELLRELSLAAGDLGENVVTAGVPLVDLAQGTELHIAGTVLRITGLRTPCVQIERFRSGLQAHMVELRADGTKRLRAGVMAVVICGGQIAVGDSIRVVEPNEKKALRPI